MYDDNKNLIFQTINNWKIVQHSFDYFIPNDLIFQPKEIIKDVHDTSDSILLTRFVL